MWREEGRSVKTLYGVLWRMALKGLRGFLSRRFLIWTDILG